MTRPRISFLPVFLGLVFLLFNAILVFVYLGAKQANPVMLDEKGRPRQVYPE
ncbi:MAG: hypothetical protein R2762_23765 [Bryobacteraceae bacterium]